MIMEGNGEHTKNVCYVLRCSDIKCRWSWVAGWVIMSYNESARSQFARAFHHLLRIKHSRVSTASSVKFVTNESISAV